VDAVENCHGFWWLFEKPDLLSGEDGVLYGVCLLVWMVAVVDGEDEQIFFFTVIRTGLEIFFSKSN